MMAPSETPAVAGSNYTLKGLYVSRLLLVELTPPEGGIRIPTPGETRPIGLNVDATASVSPNGKISQTTMTVVITPEPHVQPYRIEVTLTGVFEGDDSITTEQMTRFAQIGVPVILFPYVRELVHRVTADGRYGAVRLNPVNVAALLDQARWTQVEQQVETKSAGAMAESPSVE